MTTLHAARPRVKNHSDVHGTVSVLARPAEPDRHPHSPTLIEVVTAAGLSTTYAVTRGDDPGRFLLAKASAGEPDDDRVYAVDTGRQTCSCPDHQFRNRRCKHLACVNTLVARRLL